MNQWPECIRHIQMGEGERRGQKGAGFLPWQELGVTQAAVSVLEVGLGLKISLETTF